MHDVGRAVVQHRHDLVRAVQAVLGGRLHVVHPFGIGETLANIPPSLYNGRKIDAELAAVTAAPTKVQARSVDYSSLSSGPHVAVCK